MSLGRVDFCFGLVDVVADWIVGSVDGVGGSRGGGWMMLLSLKTPVEGVVGS